jgi:hypothetical protein
LKMASPAKGRHLARLKSRHGGRCAS